MMFTFLISTFQQSLAYDLAEAKETKEMYISNIINIKLLISNTFLYIVTNLYNYKTKFKSSIKSVR